MHLRGEHWIVKLFTTIKLKEMNTTDRIAYYRAFDEYHVKHNLSAMENLFAGYINARLDMYLDMLH